MNRRTVVLLVLLGTLAMAYGWFVLWPDGGNIRVVIVQRPSDPPRFAFNRELVVEEVRMVTEERVSPNDPSSDTYERLVWHMVPRADDDGEDDDREARPQKMVTYGRGIRGLEPAEGFRRRGEPLKPGATYRLIAETSDGTAVAEFVAK